MVAIVVAAVFANRQGRSELKSLRKEIADLQTGQTALGKDMGEVRDLLRRQPGAPQPSREIVLSVEGAPFKGNPNATVTLVEFTDYECGFCARHVKDTVPELEREYIATGKLKYVFRNFPLESIHKKAFKAHEAAVCAGEQNKFWEMHDRLFAHQSALTLADLPGHADALGLDPERFQSCLNLGRHAAQVRRDLAEGQKAGVTATPAFFLGLTTPNSSTLKVTRTLRGAKPYAAFKEAIDALLAAPAAR